MIFTEGGRVDAVDTQQTAERWDTVDEAVAALRAGRPVIVVDDADRENEGDLVMAAEFATAESLGFFVRYTSGLLCTPMAPEIADRLQLPLMVPAESGVEATAYTVSVDAVGVGSGISADDRARTARALADPDARPEELARPGHMFPLRARAGGIAERRGHTEASVDLLRLAGLHPVAVISEMCEDDGSIARLGKLRAFADEYALPLICIDQLAEELDAARAAV
ncbi:MAG TPA: 3,4-dihydroxy-2-butanone-4-phosphate synthase [Actinospica sp.]|jgi:3,4-dihydroxy 2-butanone 4-phosphate synthase/GTP cyclohydrolase II|nr:3,4-dihydroxy-2-butanone-4-phosphate synthase [Actinospica sp.]